MNTLVKRGLLTILVLLAYLPPAFRSWQEPRSSGSRAFVIPSVFEPVRPNSNFRSELITPDPVVPSVHVSSICELPDETLCAAWYGGSHEGAGDVNIYWARELGEDKAWSRPEVLVSRSIAAQELRRPIRKIGNAVLFADSRGQLRLLYATLLGGWSTSSLNLKTSHDGGKTWLASQRLALSPFLNLSELVKNNPVPLSDGEWAVPIYHECLAKFPELLWLKEANGDASWSKTRISERKSTLQPALVPLDGHSAIALMRDASSARKIQWTRSADSGQRWSPLEPLSLPNSDSGLDAIRLFDGRILLAFNDTPTARDNLSVAISEDNGRSWSRKARLESEPGAEFSYPYLIQARNGQIHVVYTWKRKSIKHAAFGLRWLEEQTRKL